MTVHPDHSSEDREDRIRALAFSIWEKEGQPEGMAEQHWRRAAEIIDAAELERKNAPDPDWLKREGETATLPAAAPSEASGETIVSSPTRLQERTKRA